MEIVIPVGHLIVGAGFGLLVAMLYDNWLRSGHPLHRQRDGPKRRN